ncbi:MAG TPA: alpha/beta hydrolase [Candidatus Limiplasma sp.]|nr:alpha/beta hydrolase [Candidatus Limiplasma sp.]HRX08296.1 alpha/beta hydrolase [Candidatus Limiplasma sp.]
MAFTQKTYANNPSRGDMARLVDGIAYSAVGGDKTTLTLLRPWEEAKRYPLVVFVQGSGWTTPNLGYEIPQLSQLARQGYVVATVRHRSATEGYPFPTFLQDVKTAIRFLRAHAEEYSIDPGRVCIYGTSSGGNTAMLVGATGNDPRYKTDEYPDVSDAVNCVVSCFGPMDLTMIPKIQNPMDGVFLGLIGVNDADTVLRAMSPYQIITADTPFPPCLIAHGTADTVVPYFMAKDMAEKLSGYGKDVRLLTVTDGPHEDTFWSQPLVEDIFTFIKAHI